VSPGLDEPELLAEESDELLELAENEQPSGMSTTASIRRKPAGRQQRGSKVRIRFPSSR